MHPNCINSVNRAAGRTLKKSELDNIEGRLNGAMKRLSRSDKTWQSKPKDQQVAEAAQLAMKDMQFEAQKKLQRQQERVIVEARESAALAQRVTQIDGKTPAHKAVFERLMQVENMVNGERHSMMSRLFDAIKAVEPRFLGMMENPAMVRDFIIEIYKGKTGRGSGNAMAEKGAKTYMGMMEQTRQRRNALGQDVGQLEAYTPRGYDVGAIARAGPAEFATDAMKGADRNAYTHEDGTRFTDDELRSFLEAEWNTLATEGRNKLVPGQSGKGSRAAKFDDAHRQIHFMDGESELAFMAKYGRGTLLQAIQGHVNQAAKDIGMMQELGPNPPAVYRMLKDAAEIIDNKEGARQFGATLDHVWDTLNGTTAQPVSANMAKVGQGVRNWTSAAKLGSVLISSINDAAGLMLTAYHNGMPLAKTMGDVIKSYGGRVKEDATRLGLATEHIAGEMRQWHADNLAQGWTDNLANTANKLSLIEAWTHAGRRGFGLSLSATLNDMRATDWGALKKQDRERMTVAGIDEATWKVWQQAKATDFDGTPILTKDGIQGISDADLHASLPGHAQAIKDQIAARTGELALRNQQEQGWIKGRIDKLDQARDALSAAVKNRLASRLDKNEKATDPLLQRMVLLDARREAAQLTADIEAQFNKLHTQQEVRDFLNAVEDGASADLTDVKQAKPEVRQGLASAEAIGRRYGEQKGKLQRQMVEIENRIAEMDRSAHSQANSEGKAAQKKADTMLSDLKDFIQRSQERQAARSAMIDSITGGEAGQLADAAQALRDRATAKLLGYIDQESGMAILKPDLITRAAITQGTRAGTWGGEIARSLMLFKSFPLAMIFQHLRRIQSIDSTGGKMAYSMALMTGTTMLGALSLQLKDLIVGKEPRDMTSGKFWGAAFAQGGGLGIFGDVMYTGLGGNNSAGQPNWSSLAGPVAGTAIDAANLTLGNIGQMLQGKKTNAGAEAVRFVRQNMPGANLFYLRAAIDHAFLHDLQETLSPGYLGRMRASLQKDWHQGYYWTPGAGFNELRAPDIQQIAGR